ncbi:hypothetical protein GCM10010401_04530 [Rarobacter faecitabidus]
MAGFAAGAAGETEVAALASRGHLDFYNSYAATIHAGRVTPPRHNQISVVWGGPDVAKVALTFDDVPAGDWTPRVLDALSAADANATFFVQGNSLEQNWQILADAVGTHEIGIHTWDHSDMGRMTLAQATDQRKRAGSGHRLGVARCCLMRG